MNIDLDPLSANPLILAATTEPTAQTTMLDPMTLVGIVIALVILIFLSGFFSASETGFTSVSETRLRALAPTKRRARYILGLHEKYDQLISTLLIGNNLVNIAASTLGVTLFVGLVGSGLGEILSTIVLTLLVLIFGEITPKMIAKRIPDKFLIFCAYPILAMYYLFWPLAKVFDGWKWMITKIFRLDKPGPSLTEEEFSMVVSDIKDEGVINQTEHDLIKNSLNFDESLVEQIMNPLTNLVYMTNAMSDEEMEEVFFKNSYSRVPYIDADSGQVLGILLQRDFYEMLLENRDNIQDLLVPAMFVKGSAKVSSLFKRMKKSRNMMALVLDDDRHLVGVCTMEDLLEELVGEIEDEQDDDDEEEGMIDDKPVLTTTMKKGNIVHKLKSNVQEDSLEYSDEELEGEEDLNEEVDVDEVEQLEDKYDND